MPSTLWTGSISFGLVSVPIKMTSATVNRDVSFNQIDADTGSRVRMRRVSEATGEEIASDKIVKGYEISKGQYVMIDPKELEAIRPPSGDAIEIVEFVPLDQIDPIYFENTYYLIPDKKGAKAYRLLVEAMAGLGRAALGRVVIRQKESLVAIRVRDGVLCLEMLRYADEVVAVSALGDLAGEDVELGEKEVAMARQLVDALSGDFDPEQFHNEYREQVLALIEAKAAGQEVSVEPTARPQAQVVDLMAALEASIARAGGGGGSAATNAGEEKKPAAKKAPAKKAARARKSA
ncbi:MAG: end-binding protein Ku [Acidimicrobiia bacterium]|nr:end-binding protein Ku [Acidimicrobiia bacterium]